MFAPDFRNISAHSRNGSGFTRISFKYARFPLSFHHSPKPHHSFFVRVPLTMVAISTSLFFSSLLLAFGIDGVYSASVHGARTPSRVSGSSILENSSNAERLRRGLPPLSPRKLWGPSKVESEHACFNLSTLSASSLIIFSRSLFRCTARSSFSCRRSIHVLLR